MTKSDFPWAFLWNFVMLLLAASMCVAQLVGGSCAGTVGFGLIAYVIVKLIRLEQR